MSIGTTIKRLRREKDITQEQLAEYLGITSRAISQWECNRTAPDISQIPALCHIFNISSDVLLGINVEKNNEEIKNYLELAQNELYQGNFKKNAEILREANRKFPRSYEIMEQLADALVSVYSREGVNEYDEVFDLCNRILAECTDSTIRYKALNTLGLAYGYAGKTEKMLELAEQTPPAHFSYENFMIYHWDGDCDFKKRQKYIFYLINQLFQMIGSLSWHHHDNNELIHSAEERIELEKLQIALLELIFPDGDYQYTAQYGEQACSRLVSIFMKTKDLENTWHWLERGIDFAIHSDTYDFEAPHTSLILRDFSDGGWIMEAEGNHSQNILNWLLNNEEAEILRPDSRYEALIKRLKKVAKKC